MLSTKIVFDYFTKNNPGPKTFSEIWVLLNKDIISSLNYDDYDENEIKSDLLLSLMSNNLFFRSKTKKWDLSSNYSFEEINKYQNFIEIEDEDFKTEEITLKV